MDALDAFLNELEAQKQWQPHATSTAALQWAHDEIARLRAALKFVHSDPCFKVLGSVTHDTVTDALGLTSILND